MSIPARLTSYLQQRGTRYEVCAHEHTRTSAQTARTAHVPPHQLAKSVLVEDDAGCLVAVLPADRQLKLGVLSRLLNRHSLRLADEARISTLLPDCDRGAVPALGMAWGLETIVDDELEAIDVVYIEGGDHEQLLRLSHDQFHTLMSDVQHGRFCGEAIH
ncbi:MAG TPA: YbaK/EbsC family protein [Ideonella sp.]|jgi:Ala-tRNA(Pro) deacylase|nr:YbaK/EbsC family protein [Ideonella sp.]